MPAIALIITDLERGRFGHARSLLDKLHGRAVLEHTLRRAARIEGVGRIVLVHPPGQDVMGAVAGFDLDKPIHAFADPRAGHDGFHDTDRRRLAARKWAMTGWRGGLGGATCYDELLPAAPLVAAMHEHKADAAVILGGDWCLFDPALASRQLAAHVEAPDAMKIVFTQAPPGLAAVVTSRAVLEDFAKHEAGFGNALGYNPRKPVIDPIGRDVCLAIPPAVRDTFERFVDDTPRGRAAVRRFLENAGNAQSAGIEELTDFCASCDFCDSHVLSHTWLELTPRREADGPITPQHHATLDRPDMPTADAVAFVQRYAADFPDATLLLGHLGEPLLHEGFFEIVEAAHAAGVFGLGVETDLLCDGPTLEQLAAMPLDVISVAHAAGVFGLGVETDLLCDGPTLEQLAAMPLDVISVRFNADTSQTYKKVMGLDGFSRVAKNLQRLFELLRQPGRVTPAPCPVVRPRSPWIVPRLTKVRENVRQIESFFDRWVTIGGCAVIDRFDTGRGRAEDLSPVPMDPPTPLRTPLDGRCAFVLSDGKVTADRSDWLGEDAWGSVRDTALREIWHGATEFAEAG